MFLIYQLLLTLVILISPFIIIVRILKGKEDIKRFKEKFCLFSKKRHRGKILWFHGSSVGEIMSAIPLLNKYDKVNYFSQILVTSSTLSSSKILQKYKFKKVIHQYFPIDHIFFSNFFINYWKPNISIFLESEIWPSMYRSIKLKKIPLILLNARITNKTFKRWSKFKENSAKIFAKIDMAFTQNEETSQFLKKLGVKRIKYIGNLKYFEDKKIKNDEIEGKLKSKFEKYKICVAASTHDNEEFFAAKTHILLKKKINKLITVIIPRHIDRVNKINNQLKNLNLKTVYHSSKINNLDNIDIYIVDTFGDSKKFYKIATTVFLGGSIVEKGGQNPLEPARYGAKILHGPNVHNFREVYNFLRLLKISKQIKSSSQFAKEIVFKKKMKNVKKIKKVGDRIFKNTFENLNMIINHET